MAEGGGRREGGAVEGGWDSPVLGTAPEAAGGGGSVKKAVEDGAITTVDFGSDS